MGDEPEVARPVSSLPARSDRLRDAMRLADEEDEEDFVATTMDAWRLAASSMLFQPAKVEARIQSSPQSMPQPQPQPSETSRDSDMVVDTCPSCRSNPIPIRPSLGSRPSTDQQTTDLADTSTLGNDGPILVEQKEIQSSLESVLCSSDSSATGTQQEVPPLDNKSSMQFPWCGMFHSLPSFLHQELESVSYCKMLKAFDYSSGVVPFSHRLGSKTMHWIRGAGTPSSLSKWCPDPLIKQPTNRLRVLGVRLYVFLISLLCVAFAFPVWLFRAPDQAHVCACRIRIVVWDQEYNARSKRR